MTATVADLVSLLERQTRNLEGRTDSDTASAHVGGWMMLAKTTRRALSLLPLGGRGDQVKAGLRTVLDPLVVGPRDPLPPFAPAAGLVRTARTMGAVADILADHLRGGGRAEQIGTEAIKLQVGLLSAVHVIARWSRSAIARQDFPKTAVAFCGQISDLIVVTEPFAMIPAAQRSSLLGGLRLRNPTAPGLEGAVTRWVAEAALVLQERYRVTGWAMQAIAGNLSLLSQVAARAVTQAAARGELPADHARDLAAGFAESARRWRAAATWPPHVRLGGSTPHLRQLGDHLRAACAGPTPSLQSVRNTLDVALPLSLLHASVMDNLARTQQLWVHRVRTDYRGQEVETWIREPPWTFEGQPLLRAARNGHQALDDAVRRLIRPDGDTRQGEGWPPEPAIAGPSRSAHLDLDAARACRGRSRPGLNP